MPSVHNSKTKKSQQSHSPQNKQNPSVIRPYCINRRGKRVFRSLNKTSQHPFRASICASLKITQRGTTSYRHSSSAGPFPRQTSSPERSLKPYLLLLCWGPAYQLGIMLLGSLPTPLCCSVKQDQLFPCNLKSFHSFHSSLHW